MSEADALLFLRSLRQHPQHHRIGLDEPKRPPWLALVELGHAQGYEFSQAELRRAFRHDWTMRWMHARFARRSG